MTKLICDKCNKEYEYDDNVIDIKDVNTAYPHTKYSARISKMNLGTFRNETIGYQYDRDIDLCPKCKGELSDIIMKFLGLPEGETT